MYAAYFLEHWNDMPHPDLLLMATRLMHHLEKSWRTMFLERKEADEPVWIVSWLERLRIRKLHRVMQEMIGKKWYRHNRQEEQIGRFHLFTEEQKERANAVPIMDILKREHEEVERSGNEWRWKRHGSVTFRGNRWYRHSQQMGSHAIDFMQEFFGMSYPEAVTYLLNGETGQVIHGGSPPRETAGKRAARPRGEETTEEKEPKILVPPEKNDTMKGYMPI